MALARKRKKRKNLRDFFSTDVRTSGEINCKRLLVGNHALDFFQSRKLTSPLVVTFEPMWFGGGLRDPNRDGWGFRWLSEQGFHVLSIKPSKNDWYRDSDLIKLFKTFQEGEVFQEYKRTIFYGGSMGGYGALAFAETARGSIVLALNPQSTLDPMRVPWETRFPEGRAQDWRGAFADAANVGDRGVSAFVVFDSHDPGDRMHVDRLGTTGITRLSLPYVGHGIPAILQKMGVLKEVFLAAADRSLTTEKFAQLATQRKKIGNYWHTIGSAQRHPDLKRALFAQGIKIDPQFPGCHIALAKLLQIDGEIDDAERVLTEALKRFPFHAETLGTYADILFAKARIDEALSFAERSAARVPTDPRAYLRIARIQLAAGRMDIAREQAELALERSTNWPGVAFSSQQLLSKLQ